MAFYPQNLHGLNKSFTPLLRLLDDFDTYSRQGTCSKSSRSPCGLPQWNPKFDVRETAEAYELYGELPGVKKENVHIEFPELQSLYVNGTVERDYATSLTPADHAEASAPSGAVPEVDAESNKSHQATVEDEEDAEWTSAEHSDPATPTTSIAENAPLDEKSTTEAKRPAGIAKYWLAERSIGRFSRTFNFPSRIDQDAVSASLQNGILSISVPKAKKHETRRIVIN